MAGDGVSSGVSSGTYFKPIKGQVKNFVGAGDRLRLVSLGSPRTTGCHRSLQMGRGLWHIKSTFSDDFSATADYISKLMKNRGRKTMKIQDVLTKRDVVWLRQQIKRAWSRDGPIARWQWWWQILKPFWKLNHEPWSTNFNLVCDGIAGSQQKWSSQLGNGLVCKIKQG